MVWSVDTLCLTGISVTLNTLEINGWIIWIIVVDICFMFNLLTMLDELFTTQWREVAAVFVLSCCVFTQFAIIGKCLTTLITAVNLFIIILFTITFIITLVVGVENSITFWTDLLPAHVHEGRATESVLGLWNQIWESLIKVGCSSRLSCFFPIFLTDRKPLLLWSF